MGAHVYKKIFIQDTTLPKIGLICLLGIGSGFVLYQSMAMELPLLWVLCIIFLMLFPFLAIRLEMSKKVFLAVLITTLALNIDQTFNLREHTGGPKGFIVSLSGIAIFILFLLFLYEKYQNRKKRFSFFMKASLPVFGIISMSVVSMSYAFDRMFSLYELLEIVKMYLIFLYIANYVAYEKDLTFILFFLIFGLFMESSIAILQFVSGSSLNLTVLGGKQEIASHMLGSGMIQRVGGTLGNSNSLAWYLVFLIPIPVSLIFSNIRGLYKGILAAIVLMGMSTLFITYSRGGWLGLLIGGMLVLYFNLKKLKMIQRAYFVFLLTMLFVVFTIILFTIPNPIQTRLTADDRGSAYVRIPLMKVALAIIDRHPLTGIGLNNYTEVHEEYDPTPEQVSYYFPHSVHNIYLLLAAEIGIPGLLFFLWFIAMVYRQALFYIRFHEDYSVSLAIGILGGLTGFLINGLVENGLIGNYQFLSLWFFSGVLCGLVEQKKQDEVFFRNESVAAQQDTSGGKFIALR